jgi:hypothetical protein
MVANKLCSFLQECAKNKNTNFLNIETKTVEGTKRYVRKCELLPASSKIGFEKRLISWCGPENITRSDLRIAPKAIF